IYSTHHDVLVVGRDGAPAEGAEVEEEGLSIHPGYLRAGMTILDVTSVPRRSRFLGEARLRGCGVVDPGHLLIEQVREHVRRITGEACPAEELRQRLAGWVGEEEDK